MVAGALWLGVALPGSAMATDTENGTGSWQERRLLQPSQSQRKQERRGQVFIYDSLDHGKVQMAMDKHFDRIENMMFTRIHHLPPTGAGPAEVEDDGCE
jgi:hypothetical protein